MATKITQCHGHMPLSGRRFGSFAGKTATAAAADDPTASFLATQLEHVARHHFPKSSSHIGARHHHGFSIFAGMRPAGA